ncbi:MAG TPA: hypothetical protein VKW08_18495 [Xanthobacteraceae bacterium]|nr:hypothetical protein [Xanthobacteraceae bacterium]
MNIAPSPETAVGYGSDQRFAPDAAEISSAANPALRFLFAVFLVFAFPAFTIQLAMDMTTGMWVGSPILQVVTIASEIFVFAVALSSPGIRSLVFQCWPMWVLIGIAFLSAIWSRNAGETIHTANTYMTTALLGVTMVGAMPQFQCIRFSVRIMVLGCILSIAWVLLFPDVAIHQLTDPYQTVHAGLWRGIFSHKQGLGYFSGLTIGLLLFYGTSIFPLPLLIAALACSITCLAGTQSATGIVASVITPAFLYVGHIVTRFPPPERKPVFLAFAAVAAAVGVAYKLGLLNYFVVQVLGKSTDLTGRADFWPIILENFYNSGWSLFGGGFGANIAADLSEWSVDNGYVDKFLEFGYFGSPIVVLAYGAILLGGARLILTTSTESSQTNIFPFGILCVILIVNITESNFMTKSLSTVLTSMALGLIFQHRTATMQDTIPSADEAYADDELEV